MSSLSTCWKDVPEDMSISDDTTFCKVLNVSPSKLSGKTYWMSKEYFRSNYYQWFPEISDHLWKSVVTLNY